MRFAVALVCASFATLLCAASPMACGGDEAGQASSSGGGTTSSSGSPRSDGGGGPIDPPGPALQLIGRWDKTNPAKPKTGWPGARLVARFEGTGAKATISSAKGVDGNETWFNVIVDGTPAANPVKVDGANQPVTLAKGLRAGPHTIELEKRTEPKWGTITIESVTFDGGELLEPPPRLGRRIEYLTDSTIDGYGVEGDLESTCNGGAPPELDNAGKSVAALAAKKLSAEPHLIAYSAKGVVSNEQGEGTTVHLPDVYTRTLPDVASSQWDFASWTPDVVVLSLGGTDLGGGDVPDGFRDAYDDLVTSIRKRHPNAHIFMTVWSQIKESDLRGPLRDQLEAIKDAHDGDDKLHLFQFTEADYPEDETGCHYHANETHSQETATELAAAIKAVTKW